MSDDLKNIVEAVLLASEGPVTVARIQGLFDEETRPDATRIHEAIQALQAQPEDRGVELKKVGSGYRYQTLDKYAVYLRRLHAVKPPRLSRALLETLAIVAYRQPVSRGDIEEVRGVAVSAEIMQRLIERGWVVQVGVRDVPGRPALFGTTAEFLSYFNLSSLKELPDLMAQRELGEIAGEMDTPLPPEVLAALELDDGEEPEDDAEVASRDVTDDEGPEALNESVDAEQTTQQAGRVEDLPQGVDQETDSVSEEATRDSSASPVNAG